MATFVPCERDQAFLLPPDMKDWLPDDDLAHFVIAAAERVSISTFQVNDRNSGKPQYHPRMMLALLVYAYANGLFSSRRIERATHCDLGVRFVTANTHPDHDTIAAFRRQNRIAFEAAFLDILLMARQAGLLRVGTVSIDGTKIDASASKIRSVRYDRAKELRAKLAADIAQLTTQAVAADAEDHDPQALPRCPGSLRDAKRSRPSSMQHVSGWRPKHALKPRPPARPTKPRRLPTTPRRVGAGDRPCPRRCAGARAAKQPDRPGQRADAPI